MKFKTKLTGMLLTLLGMLVFVASFTVVKLNGLSSRMRNVAENNIPLTDEVNNMTVAKLEQSVWVSRIQRYAGTDSQERMESALERFSEKSDRFEDLLNTAKTLSSELVSSASSEEMSAEFENDMNIINSIETSYLEYTNTVNTMVELFEENSTEEAQLLSDEVESMGDAIETKLINLTDHIQGFSRQAALDANLNAMETSRIVIIVSVFAVIAGLALGIWITRGALKQLGGDPSVMEDIAAKVSEGRLGLDFSSEGTREGVYSSLLDMVESLKYKAGILEAIAHKDLTVDIQKSSEDDGLGNSLVLMKESLNEMLSQVEEAIDQVATGSDQVSQASQTLSQGATEQASSLEEINSSVTEITSQTQQTVENTREANTLAKEVSQNAEGGNTQMKRLLKYMEEINESTDEIQKVVKTIDDISFQINLLALNANVEAARAGKYGKGFAVVAEEVRNLATRSAESVKETTEMVEKSVTTIQEGVAAAETTGDKLDEIVGGIAKVSEFLDEIFEANNEQSQAMTQISEGIDQIDQVTQSNTASAEQSASSSEELSAQAQQLKAMIDQFQLDRNGTGNLDEVKEIAFYHQDVNNGGRSELWVDDMDGKSRTGSEQANEIVSLNNDGFGRF